MRFAYPVALTSVIAGLLVPTQAFAYIDPNTGGLLFQILAPIIAMITSAWLFMRDRIKAAWYKIYRTFVPRKDEPVASAADSSSSRSSE